MIARCIACMAIAALLSGVAHAEPDDESCKDPPGFTRLRGFFIQRCENVEFDSVKMRDAKGNEAAAEGARTTVHYQLNEGEKQRSRVQVIRNYEAAFKTLGGVMSAQLDDGGENFFYARTKDGKDLWGYLNAYNPGTFSFTLVEKASMVQDVVANADAFSNDLKATGHAAVYGIYFDTGKSEVKPESEAALKELAKLLTTDAQLRLLVVGHTDSVGQLQDNMKLSQARAEAVVKALSTKHGVPAARLKALGAGPISPVATNRTDEGRAKNRRVELVEQ